MKNVKKQNSVDAKIVRLARLAREASRAMAILPREDKDKALRVMAQALKDCQDYLIKENQKDLQLAQKQKYPKALVDRLTLNAKRIEGMAQCLLDTAGLNDPVGQVMTRFTRPNGLKIEKIRTPMGVVGIIYESRPNVTSDCIGLCLKSGNAVILKGGKEAAYSNQAIFSVLRKALVNTSIPVEAIQLVFSTDRKAVEVLLKQNQYVDVIVPRGGESLIDFVARNSLIPVIKHYKGVCHTYVSDRANLDMAQSICFNAKVQRPGVCNAMETMLVSRNIAKEFLPRMLHQLQDAGVEIRGCPQTRQIYPQHVKKATVDDWKAEYLDLILAVRVVDDVSQAIEHIHTFGSNHSDAIVTEDSKEAEDFLKNVDSACVYVNASTRFTDGYEFGFGAEVGISTDKLHARGPMGLEELTTYKYLVYGKGQIRT
jgi:glutamate-5-semialdehyde dehydrogenase